MPNAESAWSPVTEATVSLGLQIGQFGIVCMRRQPSVVRFWRHPRLPVGEDPVPGQTTRAIRRKRPVWRGRLAASFPSVLA